MFAAANCNIPVKQCKEYILPNDFLAIIGPYRKEGKISVSP
jgi:hypothetical protein